MSMVHRQIGLVVAVLVAGLSTAYGAGSNSAEEAEIRKLVSAIDANGDKGMSTEDFIFWSGAYKRPVVAHDDPKQYRQGEGGISDRASSSQKLITTPQRIVVSDSKDLAYEYSKFTLEFDTRAASISSSMGVCCECGKNKAGHGSRLPYLQGATMIEDRQASLLH